MRQIAHGRAAIGFRCRQAEHAHLTHLAPQVHRELVVTVGGLSQGSDLDRGKPCHAIAQGIDILTVAKLQMWKVDHPVSFCPLAGPY